MKSFYESHDLWLICGVNRHTSWPAKNKLVRYDNTDFVLRGVYREPSREVGASIVIPLVEEGEKHDKLKILYNFCAALSWFEGRYVNIIRSMVSSSSDVGYDGDITMTDGGIRTINYELLPSNLNDTQKLALTFWKNALSDFDVFYSFLNFYKIIENKFEFKESDQRKAWFKSALEALILKNTGISLDPIIRYCCGVY